MAALFVVRHFVSPGLTPSGKHYTYYCNMSMLVGVNFNMANEIT